MSASHVLKHTPSAAASNASDQNAQTTFPIGHLGKEQLRIIGGPPNHCMAHPKHSGLREAGSAASSHSLRPLSINSEEDDGGGGARVKKKRRKKDKKESEWHRDEESNAKPKRREQKEAKELLPRKSKAAKEQKDHKKREPKAQKEVKKVKKVQDVKVKTQAKNTATHPPSKRGRKPKRSGRQVKRRKYNEDLDFKVVDDDGETIAVLANTHWNNSPLLSSQEPPEDEANIIEKILSASYLHCKWATLEELEKDPRIGQKIKRFRNKQAQMNCVSPQPDEDLFNPDYIEVDRVLEIAITTDTETGEEVTHYLVKWCSLSYEESTWELQEDVDPVKIREFEDLKEIPDIKHVERPLPEQWQKLEKSREYRNGNQLREYQLEGMNWLLFNWYNRKNCILADEMGLGKTIQSITFLYEIYLMDLRGPFLIIAPLSTITNWEREFRTWTEVNVIVYHGSQISRQMILQYEMYHRDEQGNIVSGQFKFHGIITTFEMIMADCPELKKINWRCVVIDEAHRLKNRNCKLLEGLKLMNLEHKVLLTGTPLQNSVEELFSLLNFLEPSQFPSETTFLEEFGDLKTEEQVKKLQAILKPMMLRRLKDDVEKNLAPKEETIIEVELTNIQKKYYRAILEKNFAFLAKGANQHNMPNLINTMMELRKCCNHPYLITGAEEKILESFKKTYSSDAVDFQLQAMIQAAGKLVLIDKLLPKLLAGGHKVLVFSQMVRCLDILEDYLIQRRYTYERIDGRVRGNLRQAAIDRFSKVDSDRFVFLLCTRAGGLGINLTAADTCIIFDSDWNPQNDLQAQARCHRIGQSKAVKVYRLITRNSYEREMFDKASLKLGLDKAVLQDINRKGSLNGVQQLSKMEVEDLLRKGAYGALMDEEDEGSKFCEEDIDQILQRRTQTITIQSEGKGSTFAKASFVSSGNRTDISLDDPNFWQKWAKIAELEIDSKESLVIDTPRVRKQTRHYNSFEDDELMEFSELDSDSEERPCRTRRLSDRNRRYLRAECFRVEKNLLIFGWGRWKDILNHGRFKWHLTERDMEVLCRALLVYCVRHYKGDDKIKSFIWDLITPTKDGHNQALQNHSGLSAPVPRGRKGKKLKNQLSPPELKNADWLVHCNPEVVLQDDSYKKHLKQHCNKVLLRVRMLYYLKVEVLGEASNQALEGIPASKLEVTLPDIDYIEIPTIWWDAEADKSLLIGVHKHGYERYNAMRADPALCFLERVGMPDVTALTVEQSGAETASDVPDSKSDTIKEENDIKSEELEEKVEIKVIIGRSLAADLVAEVMEQGRIQWPAGSALTARLRRLITAYQRYTRREPLRHDFLLHEGIAPVAWQIGEFRWTRREQADFNRTVSSFGVVYDPEKKTLDWSQFRALARLERKTDESLERYFHSFVSMCRTACRLPPRKDEGNVDPSLFVEPITEERAARTLYRIELLRKVREQVLRHPLLGARLQLCRPSLYLPVWWECGKHDRDLLIGVAKHGLSRTDFYILNDPQLSFLEAHRNYVHKENHRYSVPGLPHHHCCLYDANLGHCQSPQPPDNPIEPLAPSFMLFKDLNVGETSVDQTDLSASLPEYVPPPPPLGLPDVSLDQTDPISEEQEDKLSDSSITHGVLSPEEGAESLGFQDLSPDSPKTMDTQDEMPSIESPSENFRPTSYPALSFCPLQDRVIINRIDSICHTILKGKWPSSSQQYESPTSLANTSSAHQRAGFLSTRMPISQSLNYNPHTVPHLAKVGVRSHHQTGGFSRCLQILKKFLEIYGNKLYEWKNLEISGGPIGQMSHTVQSAPHKITGIGSIQGSLGLDMAGILQAGLIHPVTGQIVNGGLHRDDSMLRRRKGRRRNVETPDLSFIKGRSSQNASMLHSFLERPKQRRHRCKDPTKLDVNSLTGEERVPVVHRNTGRRLGGAMAPAIKELSRWLDANSEYSVAPDWADVVKHSGFLPEGKFTRILSGPVCRDPGPRRRGRRPRSEMPKAHELPAGMGPLFMNGGLIGSMDLVSLPSLRNVPGIPLTGIMGFPHGFATAIPSGDDAKNGLSMLPMMLHGMAAVQPPMYSAHMSGMMNQPLSTATSTVTASSTTASVTSTNSATVTSSSNPADSSDFAPAHDNASSPMSTENGNMEDAKQGGEEKKVSASVSTAAATSSSSSSSITSTGSHLTFNPFLIPGMSHSLLYPHMFLPPGSIMALPAMTAADSTGSPKRKRKKVREEGPEEGSSNVGVHIDGVESKQVKDEQTPEQKSQEGRMEEGRPDVDLARVKDPSEDRSTEEKDKNEMGEEPRPNAQGLCVSGD
uniref:Chromodomain-helicase-DNA-binding protein 6-like n=1 Tax=Sinocyclocheilus grahami TaxID=75366 RepID=A0A672SQY5_SINGR